MGSGAPSSGRADQSKYGERQASSTSRQGSLRYVYPKEDNITSVQATWLRSWLQEFENALFGPNWLDPVEGYAPYIDMRAYVDHHILNTMAMNVDAYRLSGYLHKPRNGPLTYGPIWDFDRSMGSTDGRDDNPRTWQRSTTLFVA